MWKKAILSLSIAALLTQPITAAAAVNGGEPTGGQAAAAVTADKTVGVRIFLSEELPTADITWSVYKVGQRDNDTVLIDPEYSGLDFDLTQTSDAQVRTIAQDIAGYITEKGLMPAVTATPAASGTSEVSGLPCGIYLIVTGGITGTGGSWKALPALVDLNGVEEFKDVYPKFEFTKDEDSSQDDSSQEDQSSVTDSIDENVTGGGGQSIIRTPSHRPSVSSGTPSSREISDDSKTDAAVATNIGTGGGSGTGSGSGNGTGTNNNPGTGAAAASLLGISALSLTLIRRKNDREDRDEDK